MWKMKFTAKLSSQCLWVNNIDSQRPLTRDYEIRRRDLLFKNRGRTRQRVTADRAVGPQRRQDGRRQARHLFILDDRAALGAGEPDVEAIRFANLVHFAH